MILSFLYVFIPAMLVELCRIKYLPFSELLGLYRTINCDHCDDNDKKEEKSELENEVEEVRKELQSLIDESEQYNNPESFVKYGKLQRQIVQKQKVL